MIAILKKEIKSYFYSPIAYVLIGFFFLCASFIFYSYNLSDSQNSNINITFSVLGYPLIVLIPILTMRLLSEDMKSKSDILLITSPAKISEIVVGKYLAAVSIFLVMVLSTLPFTIICYACGEPNTPVILSGYLGFILLGFCFAAIGIFASALTENQIISAVISFAISLAMVFMDTLSTTFPSYIGNILSWLSILSRYNCFYYGYVELSSFVYYISFIALFLFVTVMIIEKRRWSKN